jgi:hypothetical protein
MSAVAFPLAFRHLLERGVVAQAGEPALHRRPRRKTLRQQPPDDPAARGMEHGIHDLSHWPSPPPAGRTRLGWKKVAINRHSASLKSVQYRFATR